MVKKLSISKLIHQFHGYAGVIIAVHFFILSLSGIALLFKENIQGQQKIAYTEIPHYQEKFAEKYQQALLQLQNQYPNDRPLDIYPDKNNASIIKARLGKNGATLFKEAYAVYLDFNTGSILTRDGLPASKFYKWILNLHRQLFMATAGQLYIGCISMLYILMLLSGFFLFLKRKKPHHPARIPLKLKIMNLHKNFGSVIFIWGLIAGISGMLLAFEPLFTKHFQQKQLSQLTSRFQIIPKQTLPDAPLRDIIHSAMQNNPDGIIWHIVFPGAERGVPGHYLVLMHGNGFMTKLISEYLVINAKTAAHVETVKLPTLLQSSLVATPVHFANYGGFLLKLLWALFAAGSLFVALLGISLFILKRKRRYAA